MKDNTGSSQSVSPLEELGAEEGGERSRRASGRVRVPIVTLASEHPSANDAKRDRSASSASVDSDDSTKPASKSKRRMMGTSAELPENGSAAVTLHSIAKRPRLDNNTTSLLNRTRPSTSQPDSPQLDSTSPPFTSTPLRNTSSQEISKDRAGANQTTPLSTVNPIKKKVTAAATAPYLVTQYHGYDYVPASTSHLKQYNLPPMERPRRSATLASKNTSSYEELDDEESNDVATRNRNSNGAFEASIIPMTAVASSSKVTLEMMEDASHSEREGEGEEDEATEGGSGLEGEELSTSDEEERQSAVSLAGIQAMQAKRDRLKHRAKASLIARQISSKQNVHRRPGPVKGAKAARVNSVPLPSAGRSTRLSTNLIPPSITAPTSQLSSGEARRLGSTLVSAVLAPRRPHAISNPVSATTTDAEEEHAGPDPEPVVDIPPRAAATVTPLETLATPVSGGATPTDAIVVLAKEMLARGGKRKAADVASATLKKAAPIVRKKIVKRKRIIWRLENKTPNFIVVLKNATSSGITIFHLPFSPLLDQPILIEPASVTHQSDSNQQTTSTYAFHIPRSPPRVVDGAIFMSLERGSAAWLSGKDAIAQRVLLGLGRGLLQLVVENGETDWSITNGSLRVLGEHEKEQV
jgi:hypothetical protein